MGSEMPSSSSPHLSVSSDDEAIVASQSRGGLFKSFVGRFIGSEKVPPVAQSCPVLSVRFVVSDTIFVRFLSHFPPENVSDFRKRGEETLLLVSPLPLPPCRVLPPPSSRF